MTFSDDYAYLDHVQAALFDIDGTLTTGGGVWGTLLKHPDVKLSRKAWVYLTGVPHHLATKTPFVGQASFRDRWVRLMARLLNGWVESEVQDVCAAIVREQILSKSRGDVADLLHEHKRRGHVVILVSTMFDFIVNRTAVELGANVGLGSRLRFSSGVCTGKIEGQTCSGSRKVEFAEAYLRTHFPEISLAQCAAYADSQSDIPFIAATCYPVAVYPDDVMRSAAEEQDWLVIG